MTESIRHYAPRMLRRSLLPAVVALLLAACVGGGGGSASPGGGDDEPGSVWKPDLGIEIEEPACAPLREIASDTVPMGDAVAGEDWDDIEEGLLATEAHVRLYSDAQSKARTRTLLTRIRDVGDYVALSSSIAQRATDTDEYVEDLAAHPKTPNALEAREKLDAWTRSECGFSIIEGIDGD